MTTLLPAKLPPTAKEKSLDDLWKVYVKLKGELAPSYVYHLHAIGRKFCDFVRDKPLTMATILKWMILLKEQKSIAPRQLNWMNTRIKGFLRWLKLIGLVQDSLHEGITSFHAPALGEPQVFTEEEYEKIKAYCTGRPWCQVHLWLIILGYRTGMSMVDCCHLR